MPGFDPTPLESTAALQSTSRANRRPARGRGTSAARRAMKSALRAAARRRQCSISLSNNAMRAAPSMAFGVCIESPSLRAFLPSTLNIPTAQNLCDGTRVQGRKPLCQSRFSRF